MSDEASEFLVQDVKAPHWADFAAMNKDGQWIWFGEKPRPSSKGWITGYFVNPNRFNVKGFGADCYDGSWIDSLQIRPDLMNLKIKIELLNDEIKKCEKKKADWYQDIKREHLKIHEIEDKILDLRGY